MSAHDRYLAQYRTHPLDVWCHTSTCRYSEEPLTARYESEYGQSWITPEECPECGGELHEEPPKEEDGDDE